MVTKELATKYIDTMSDDVRGILHYVMESLHIHSYEMMFGVLHEAESLGVLNDQEKFCRFITENFVVDKTVEAPEPLQ